MILRLALVGFGNVGQEFVRLLQSRRDWLIRRKGLDVEVHAIVTRSKGSLLSKKALDLERVMESARKGTFEDYGPEYTLKLPLKTIEACDADLMVELTTLNIDSGQPALDHIRTALSLGMDVVTANKGPIAYAYDELARLARSRGVRLRFEGTVMDGTPVFNLVERTLPGCEVVGIRGILNSTSNFVLTEMAAGSSMEEAVREAQRRGIAEADPSLDIDGWDAAAKITVLANVLMGAKSDPRKVDLEGIRAVDRNAIEDAATKGAKIKLVARAERMEGGVRTSVRPELVGRDSAFWSVDGTSSGITLSTDLMGELTVLEDSPALTQTAYAVFSDMLLIVESIRAGTL